MSSLIFCKKSGTSIRQQEAQYDYCSYAYMVTYMINNEYVNNFGFNIFLLQPKFVELSRKVKIHFICKSDTSTSKSN